MVRQTLESTQSYTNSCAHNALFSRRSRKGEDSSDHSIHPVVDAKHTDTGLGNGTVAGRGMDLGQDADSLGFRLQEQHERSLLQPSDESVLGVL